MRVSIKRGAIIICMFIVQMMQVAQAVDPRLNWSTIESQNFYIHYANGYERLAKKTATIAEQAHNKLQPKLNWQPYDKTHLIVSDETDFANGYATPIHFNRSVLFVAPPDSANGIEDFDDWLETLITHEYTHILHLDKVNGGVDMLHNIFGRHFLLFPNGLQPAWFIEGLATHYETDIDKGIGRGQSSLFKMMMRTEVENGIKPANQVNLPIRSWPMGTVSYLYGVHFYQFVEDVYGEGSVKQLVDNYSGNIIPFKINSNSEDIFEKNIDELWEEFSEWLNKRYLPEILAQQKIGIVEGHKVTDLGYRTKAIDLNKRDEVYYVADGAFEHANLTHQVGDVTNVLSEVHRGAQIDVHEHAGVLVIQNENCDEYNINSDLYIIEKNDNEPRRLTECGRYRSASWSADGQTIFAIKTDKGISQLDWLNNQGEKIKKLWKGNDTDIVSQLKSSPSGREIVAAVFRKGKGWNIEEFNLKTLKWNAITSDKHIDMYPSYSNDGKAVLFSSDRSGRYQIYRYRKDNKTFAQLTRVSTGAFNSAQVDENSALYYAGYNDNGRDIYKLDKVSPVGEEVKFEFSLEAPDKKLKDAPQIEISGAENYSAISTMYPRWWFPFLSLSEDRNEYGISTSASDALGIHNYNLTLSYDTNNKWLSGNVNYAYANRLSIGYQRSTDILRDSEGNFAVARNVDDVFLSIGYSDPGFESSVRYQVGVVASQSSDGRRADGIPQQLESKDNLVGAAILYDNTQNYIRSISSSDGRNIRLVAETTDWLESDFSGEIYTLDWREFIGLGNQNVLALRLVQGWGTEQPKSFRLGGEDNELDILNFINPISNQIFDKREYSLRGYAEGLPQLSGRRMQLATLEWRFPGSLVERGFMAPPIGLIQWSGSVFTETGAAYNESSADQYYTSAGIELQADVNLFYGITSRMRLGFASGFDSEIGDERVYFNLGAAF